MAYIIRRHRRIFAWSTLVVMAASLLPPASFAESEKRLFVDLVNFEPSTLTLTINADILDPQGEPMPKIEEGDLEILANGQPLKIAKMEIDTADKAKEPIAICVLMNASASYQTQGGEAHSTYDHVQEGVGRLIKTMSDDDKIAVLRYREGAVHEVVYAWASNFNQAK